MAASGHGNDTEGLARHRYVLQRMPLHVGQLGGCGVPHDADEPDAGIGQGRRARHLTDHIAGGQDLRAGDERRCALHVAQQAGGCPRLRSSRRPPDRGSIPSWHRSCHRAQPRTAAIPCWKSAPIRGTPIRIRQASAAPVAHLDEVGLHQCVARRATPPCPTPASRSTPGPRTDGTVPGSPTTDAPAPPGIANRSSEVVASSSQHVGGQDVGGQQQADVVGLLGGLDEHHVVVASQHLDVGTDPTGRREQQRASGPSWLEPGDVGRQEVVEPGNGVRALDPNLAPVGQVDEPAALVAARRGRARRQRGRTSPSSAIIGIVDVPSTLLVTNDFPPRVGGIQRTLEALWRELPAERVGVFCPDWDDAAAYDAGALRSVSSDSPSASSGWRRRARTHGGGGADVRGDVPARPARPEAGLPRPALPDRRARLRVLALDRAGHPRAAASRDVASHARAGVVRSVHRAQGSNRGARSGSGFGPVSRR